MKTDIDKLLFIANDPKFMQECEPYVCYHFPIEEWMIVRVIKAQEKLKRKRGMKK